ncbi:MAG: S9 family peptidase [Deltaproteobacteria bacterium]|nr:S9 family peptidase [Deltaproteobacteria bacterium]
MSAKRRSPFGAWPSPLGAEDVAAASVRLAEICLDGVDVYWTESRPAQQGRLALLHKPGGKAAREIVPAPFSVRTRVHEYGGGAFAAAAGQVVFSNDSDQRLYRIAAAGRAPTPLTPVDRTRYADLQLDLRRQRLLCVAERAREGREPENFLAAVSLGTGQVTPLARGSDFYAFPRLDPAGRRLAFLRWNHPAMPWDACELHVADIRTDGSLGEPVRVAGGSDESIFQPAWSPRGELTFVSDRNGFANLFRLAADGSTACLCEREADFAAPLWVFGLSTHAWLGEETIVCVFQRSGLWHLATLDTTSGRLDPVETGLTELGPIFAGQGRAVFVGGAAGQASALFTFDGRSRRLRLLHRPTACPIPKMAIARPRPFDFPTADGTTAHGLLYFPLHKSYRGTSDSRPPLLVTCHGGPTASTSTALNLSIQFWTSRGFAVLDVNYRGSTGYGRAYRKLLDGQWGVADVEDCVAAAATLAEAGLVDGGRMAIRGSSAGGFTVLCALAFHDVFAAGASYYGVADLEALAKDTHKFESHYLDSLIGPYPQRRDLYRARSPLLAADRLACPVIFFQGEQDRVVPKAQAVAMAAALRKRGLSAPLWLFPDEQHGFRQGKTIRAALDAELEFYLRVFGVAS